MQYIFKKTKGLFVTSVHSAQQNKRTADAEAAVVITNFTIQIGLIVGLIGGTIPLYCRMYWPSVVITFGELYLIYTLIDNIKYANVKQDTKVSILGYSLFLMNVIVFVACRNAGHYGVIFLLKYVATIIKNLWLDA